MGRYSAGAESILEECMGVKKGEKIAIVSDPDRLEPALEIVRTAERMGLRASLKEETHSIGDELHNEDRVLSEIKDYDVTIFLVSYKKTQNLGHSDWRKAANQRGMRISFIIGSIENLSQDQVDRMRKRTEFISKFLTDAEVASVRSLKGTDIVMSLRHRKSLSLTNHIREKGSWGVLPDYMEATIAPEEGQTNGVAIIDGTVFGIGLLDEPIKLIIESGEVKNVSGSWEARRLREMMDGSGVNGDKIGELGVGTNHLPYVLGGDLEDRKVLGTIHLALGDNLALGGRIRCKTHTDLQILNASIQLDKRTIMEDGKLIMDFDTPNPLSGSL